MPSITLETRSLISRRFSGATLTKGMSKINIQIVANFVMS